MYQEKYSVNPYKKEILELYFNLIMIKLAERLSLPLPQGNNPHYENICALRAKIYNIPNFGWTVENMAHSMILSESYFQHLYKQIFGISPLGDVICARIDRAQYLLSSTDYKLNRIAAECGYKSDIHFMRQFKKEIGITPSEYRKRFYLSADKKEEMYKKAPYKILPQ